MSGRYDDIIHLPHHVSATRPQMSVANRAAQFSPFAALTGHGAAIQETARRTDGRVELDENAIAALDRKLRLLAAHIKEHPEVAVTHFQKDERKDGGAYVTTTGSVKKIDVYERVLVLMDGTRIRMADLVELECEWFEEML